MGAEFATLLEEASFAGEASLASALRGVDGQPHPRIGWLTQQLSVSKRACWAAIQAAAGTPAPPPELNLEGLCGWEVQQAQRLDSGQLGTAVDGHRLDVAGLLRLNVRQTVWAAGQIAALSSGPKLV